MSWSTTGGFVRPRFPDDPELPQEVFEPPPPRDDPSLHHVSEVLLTSWRNYMVQKTLRELWHMNDDHHRVQNVIRVNVNDDGTVDLLDFSMPSELGRKKERIPQEDVPTWIMEAISMLRIAPENDLVPDLGFKVSDTLYFVVPKQGESDEQS